MNTNDLRHYIELWGLVPCKNELGENDYKGQKIKNVYAQIIPLNGNISNIQNIEPQVNYMSVSHKIKIRYLSYPKLNISNWFVYKGLKYEIVSINQDFKNREFLEIIAKVVYEGCEIDE